MKAIIIFLTALAVTWYFCKCRQEGMADLSTEAVQNIASVYNKDNLTVSNVTVTGKVTSGTFAGTSMALDKDLSANNINASAIGTKSLVTSGGSGGIQWPNSPSYFPWPKDNKNYIIGDTIMDGNVTISQKDCKWVGNGYAGIAGSSYPGSMDQCFADANAFAARDPAQWNQLVCPDGYFMTGTRMAHQCGDGSFWHQIPEIKCCRF